MRVMTDEIIEVYMWDVDRTSLRENLKLTPTQRFEQLMQMQELVEELQRTGRRVPEGPQAWAELKALLQEKTKGF